MGALLEALSANSAIGDMFSSNISVTSYKTGLAPLDYYLGYQLNVHDENNNVIDSYPALGINGGCYVMVIGKSSTAKTSIMLSISANIVRPFPESFIIHYDLEQAMNATRAKILTRFTIREMKDKYILKQMNSTMEDIKVMLMNVYKEKTSNPDKFLYDTGKKDEFNNPVIIYQPTVVIIDSIPSLTVKLSESNKNEWAKLEEITSPTERMRLTGEIARFYTDLLPYLKAANIIVISINHITVNPQMGIVKSPSELLYLKQDEALSGGKKPVYLSHYLLKNVAIGSEKYNLEDDGFDGVGIRIEIIKARSNQAGQSVEVIFDKVRGVSPIRTCIKFAKDNGLTGGNKNAMYFINNKDVKFSLKEAERCFSENKELYKIMYAHILPLLETHLSAVKEAELLFDEEVMDY